MFSFPAIITEVFTIYASLRFVQEELAVNPGMWVILSFLLFEIHYLNLFWISNNRHNLVNVLNKSYELLECTHRASFPYSTILLFITITFYIVKIFVMPYGFVLFPSLHYLIYVRFIQILAFETLMDALTSAAEIAINDINNRVRTIQQGNDIVKRLKVVIVLRWKVDELVKTISHTFGSHYFLLIIVNVTMVILVLSWSVKKLMSPIPTLMRTSMYGNIVEWHLSIYSIWLICRRSNRLKELVSVLFSSYWFFYCLFPWFI